VAGFIYSISGFVKKVDHWMTSEYNELVSDIQRTQRLADLTESSYKVPDKPIRRTYSKDLISVLSTIGANLQHQFQTKAELRKALNAIGNDFMNKWANKQRFLWQDRVNKLCERPNNDFPLNNIKFNGSLDGYFDAINSMSDYSDHIWYLYEKCHMPIIEVIDENLLKFTFNRWDKFDMTDEAVKNAIEQIKQIVDAHKEYRNIYVNGHCDKIGDDEPNLVLSYQRAMYVGIKIREYLISEKRLTENKDFKITLSGFGKTQLLEQKPNESKDEWCSRCRRIELAFQKMPLKK